MANLNKDNYECDQQLSLCGYKSRGFCRSLSGGEDPVDSNVLHQQRRIDGTDANVKSHASSDADPRRRVSGNQLQDDRNACDQLPEKNQ